jgi:hypothetical protein
VRNKLFSSTRLFSETLQYIFGTPNMSEAKYEEVTNYFKERMAQSRAVAAARGKEARIAAAQAKAASGNKTWRQLSGARLMAHEISHVGNRPFMVGFA